MISIKKILVILGLIFLVLPLIHALTFSTGNIVLGIWYDQFPSSTSISTVDGSTIDFNVYALAVGSSLSIDVSVVREDGTVVPVAIINRGYKDFNEFGIGSEGDYSITNSEYGGPGNHKVRLTVMGTVTSSIELDLVVTSGVTNNAPVITSTPLVNVNEGQIYNYQMTATDADANTLSYALLQNPNWLSIDAVTGLVSGTAPFVTADTPYTVIARVTDGIDTTTQTWTVTVVDTGASADLNAPVVTIIYPINVVYDFSITSLSYTAVDAEGNLDSCWYSLDFGVSNSTLDSTCSAFNGLASVEGSNTWTVYARDTFGNVGSSSITFIVDTSSSPSTTSGGSSSSKKATKISHIFRDTDALYLDNFVPERNPTINLAGARDDTFFLLKFLKTIWEFFKGIAEVLI